MDTLLSTQERHELVSVLRQLDPHAPSEQRHAPRRKALVNLWIRRIGKKTTKAVARLVLVNVSQNGVGFLAKSEFAAGEKFVMPLRFDEGGRVVGFVRSSECQRACEWALQGRGEVP